MKALQKFPETCSRNLFQREKPMTQNAPQSQKPGTLFECLATAAFAPLTAGVLVLLCLVAVGAMDSLTRSVTGLPIPESGFENLNPAASPASQRATLWESQATPEDRRAEPASQWEPRVFPAKPAGEAARPEWAGRLREAGFRSRGRSQNAGQVIQINNGGGGGRFSNQSGRCGQGNVGFRGFSGQAAGGKNRNNGQLIQINN